MDPFWHSAADFAYLSLMDPDDPDPREEYLGVEFSEPAEETGIEALRKVVLEFQPDGKLRGIEIAAVRSVLRPSTLEDAERL